MNKKSIKDVISRFSFLVPRSPLGFASILPLLIIALAAISSSTPLLVENLLNGNPPGQKIASNNVQQIAGLPEGETYKICDETGILISCSNDRIKTFKTQNGSGQTTYTECNTGLTCNKSGNCAWCVKKTNTPNQEEVQKYTKITIDGKIIVTPVTYIDHINIRNRDTNELKKIEVQASIGSIVYLFEVQKNSSSTLIYSAYSSAAESLSSLVGTASEIITAKETNLTIKQVTINALTNTNLSCYSKHGSREDECKADTDCAWFPGNDLNGTGRSCLNGENAGLSCGTVGYCSKDYPFCIDGTYCSNTPGKSSPSTETDAKITITGTVVANGQTYTSVLIGINGLRGFSLDKSTNNSYTAVFPGSADPKLQTKTYTIHVQALNGSSIPQQSLECTGGCTVTLGQSNVTKTITVSLGTSAPAPDVDDPVDNGPQQPAQKSEPISGTVNVVGSTTASQVTVSVNGSTYSASKDSGIAWKYKTADLPAGSYTVTATATLVNSNGTLSGTTTANSGSTTADITISAYSTDIISEKCGAKGVSENSISGFLYTACMASSPTTLTEAEKGKFDQNKAALAKDNGNPYCGTNAFDVYQCKDGSIETIAIGESEDTCNKFPWCPEKGKTGLTTDPCAGPDNRPETCSCQPDSSSAANGKYTQDNCATDLYCAPGKNPQVPGYACCPKYEQFCPATNTCIGTNESCGSGVKTPDKLPDNQQSLGCPNTNSDGTQNVCSTISSSSSQPTDGIQSGNPGYNSSKNYTRNQNGDKACADNYASTKNANFKYCWKESGSASSGGGGGGGTGGQQPGGGGSAGFIGKACPSNPDKTSSSYLATECENKTDIYADDYYCTKDFKGATWACCQFGTRFCSLNNLCVSSENDCIAPTPIPNSGNGNTTQPGTAGGPGSSTNYCYNGQKDCTPGYLCSNPAGGSTAQCVVRTPEDPESNCAIAKGFECTDTYDATLNVDDALARDVCRSVGKKYCAKKAQPAQSGCPHALDTSGNKLSDSKSICQTSSTCPAGTKPGSSANNAACGTGQYCCIDTRYSGSTASTQSVASTPESTCKTSKDCVNSKSGNACVYFTSASTGICKTY